MNEIDLLEEIAFGVLPEGEIVTAQREAVQAEREGIAGQVNPSSLRFHSSSESTSGKIPTEAWVLPRPRSDCYVGSFPLHFEKKLWRTLGEPEKVLHPFGGLAEIGDFVDLNPTTTPTWVGDAHDMDWIEDNTYDWVMLDPPYSDEESDELYGTPPLRPGEYIKEAVRVCKVGGLVSIYHRAQPARPNKCKLVHRVVVLTRTNHAARICFTFEKIEE